MQAIPPPTIVFLGDSITEGVIGASFVDRVHNALAGRARIVNAGINGDTVVNMRWRVRRDVAAHQPDVVVVMSGLNDIGTAHALMPQRIYYRLVKGNLVDLTPRRFAAGYRALLAEIRRYTRAQIILCTPTTLTEDPAAAVQTVVDTYAVIVRSIAHQQGLALIDVREAFTRAVAADPRPGPAYDIKVAIRDLIAIRWGRATYEGLAKQRGYRLTCDGAHLAEAGANLLASVVVAALERSSIEALRR